MTTGGPRACIAGVGSTEFSRDSGRSVNRLAAEAISAALADAGVEPHEVDGLIPFNGGPSAEDVMGMFGLVNIGFTAVPHMGGAGSVAALRLAALAIESGEASVVIAFVARNGRSGTKVDQRVLQLPGQSFRQELEWPSGMNSPAQWYALMARRHMIEYGTSREALATVAITQRANAQLNPAAQMFGRELTMEQYAAAPMIADPYLLFDCCLETDGACAVIVTSRNRAVGAGRPVVEIAGSTEAHPSSADDIANRADILDIGLSTSAARAFTAARMSPADVDVALIYDPFTFQVIQQLEAAGFCERGEGGSFVEDGNTALGASLPVNPHGGLLSEGHIAGMNHIIEGVRQLRGDAGERQVAGAEVAFVTGWGDMGDGSAAVLTRG